MELEPVEAARLVGDAGERRGGGFGDDFKTRWKTRDAVAVAHPHVQVFRAVVSRFITHAFKELRVPVQAHACVAELALLAGLDRAAELRRHGLLAVADAENGNSQLEDFARRARSLRERHRLRSAGEDHAARRELPDLLGRRVVGMDLAVDAGLAHPPGDELGVLRAEVED